MRITYDFFKLVFIPKFYYSIFGFSLGLGKSKSKQSSSSNTTLDKTVTGNSKSKSEQSKTGFSSGSQQSQGKTSGKSSATSEGVETSTLSLLDDETKGIVSDLLASVAEGDSGNQELLGLLESRAAGADDAFSGIVDPQVAEARRLQEQELGTTVQALSRAAGGGAKSNSLVASFDLEGERAINSSIASLAASLGIESRNAATDEIKTAFTAGLENDQSDASAVAALSDVLKGATQTGSTTTTQSQEAVSIEDVVQSLQNASSESEVASIIESLFSEENTKGTSKTNTTGKVSEKSIGLGLSGSGG